jgi:spore germination cell wall hydrolase CwlJ-like protein
MFKKISLSLVLGLFSTVINANSNIRHDLLLLKKAYKETNISTYHLTNSESCLAKNIYFEARGTSLDEQFLVGIVTITRAMSNLKNFTNTICSVVAQKNQFSWYKKNTPKIIEKNSWKTAVKVTKILLKYKFNSTLKYFHKRGERPIWSRQMRPIYTGLYHYFY